MNDKKKTIKIFARQTARLCSIDGRKLLNEKSTKRETTRISSRMFMRF